MEHLIAYTPDEPPLDGRWDRGRWGGVEPLDVRHFHARSSDHRPRVQVKLLHSGRALHVLFRVEDRFVRAACERHGEKVCKDSCVEIFLEPPGDRGYFNVEANCGGTLLVWHVEDPTPSGGGLLRSTDFSAEAASQVRVFHSLPRRVPDEIAEPIEWHLQLAIPVATFERHVGAIGDLRGQAWRGNLFKCADGTSRPHWASWSPIGEELNFHRPEYFGTFVFASEEIS